MSEENEVVPVKIEDVSDSLKYIVGDKYAVHVVMTQPPEVTFGYCFRTAFNWMMACAIWSVIFGIAGMLIWFIIALLTGNIR